MTNLAIQPKRFDRRGYGMRQGGASGSAVPAPAPGTEVHVVLGGGHEGVHPHRRVSSVHRAG
jgi:hypothetical protein